MLFTGDPVMATLYFSLFAINISKNPNLSSLKTFGVVSLSRVSSVGAGQGPPLNERGSCDVWRHQSTFWGWPPHTHNDCYSLFLGSVKKNFGDILRLLQATNTKLQAQCNQLNQCLHSSWIICIDILCNGNQVCRKAYIIKTTISNTGWDGRQS